MIENGQTVARVDDVQYSGFDYGVGYHETRQSYIPYSGDDYRLILL